MFLFDESVATFRATGRPGNGHVARQPDKETVNVRQVDPAELSPGEFAHAVREAVDKNGARVSSLSTV